MSRFRDEAYSRFAEVVMKHPLPENSFQAVEAVLPLGSSNQAVLILDLAQVAGNYCEERR